VLSLYVSTDPTKHMKDEYRLVLRKLLDEAGRRGAAQADITAVDRYFDYEFDWQGKGVAVFSCDAARLWQAFPLYVAVPNLVEVAEQPYVKPLSDLLSEHQRFGVVLVEQEKARMFAMRMGQIEERLGTIGDEIKKVRRGGTAATSIALHTEDHAFKNMKDAANLTRQFCEANKCERLIIGGSDVNVAKFIPLLPKAWQEKVVATVKMDIVTSEQQVLDASRAIMDASVKEHQQELVRQMIDAASKGGPGAMGMADTLAALQDKRVYILLVHEGFQAPGYRCTHCGFLSAQEMSKCPFCGGDMVKNDNAVDDLLHNALAQGVKVELIADSEELRNVGSIGAILRY
jgi:peptide subunit release factor 1 (eRF1)